METFPWRCLWGDSSDVPLQKLPTSWPWILVVAAVHLPYLMGRLSTLRTMSVSIHLSCYKASGSIIQVIGCCRHCSLTLFLSPGVCASIKFYISGSKEWRGASGGQGKAVLGKTKESHPQADPTALLLVGKLMIFLLSSMDLPVLVNPFVLPEDGQLSFEDSNFCYSFKYVYCSGKPSIIL